MQQDLFEFPHDKNNSFDYLLEYTCFCAIDSKRRMEYADLVTRLLKPNGIYIDLAFPLAAERFRILSDEEVLVSGREHRRVSHHSMADTVHIEGSAELGFRGICDRNEMMPCAVIDRRHIISAFAHAA